MPNHTEHYKLIKPTKTELYNIDDVTNDNADKIDSILHGKIDKPNNVTENNIPIFNANGSIQDSGQNMIGIANAFMVTELPEASEKYNNICYMYIGESYGEIDTNNFYKCILDSTTKKYKWSKITLAGINHIPVETVDNIPIYSDIIINTSDND